MKPRTFCFVAIAEAFPEGCSRVASALCTTLTRLPPRLPGSSVLDRYAIEIVAFELLAGGVGGFFVEAGEAGAIERLVALEHALGERIGGGELVVDFALRGAQMLLGLVFAGIGADLDQPAAVGADLRRRFGLCRLGFSGLGAGRRDRCNFGLGDIWR